MRRGVYVRWKCDGTQCHAHRTRLTARLCRALHRALKAVRS